VNEDANRDLSRLYRGGAREEPPAWLDQEIMAAARRDVLRPDIRAYPGPRARWQVPLALAAVLTLAVSLALVMEGELEQTPAASSVAARDGTVMPEGDTKPSSPVSQDPREPERSAPGFEQPLQAPAAAASHAVTQSRAIDLVAPKRGLDAESSDRRAGEEAGRAGQHVDGPDAATPAIPPAPAAPALSPAQRMGPILPSTGNYRAEKPDAFKLESAPGGEGAGARNRAAVPGETDDERALLGRDPAKAPAVPPTGATHSPPTEASGGAFRRSERIDERAAQRMPPEDWLREIEQLRRDGREEQARIRLAQFLERFPSYPLPESLK
jgi:hypothetical protein